MKGLDVNGYKRKNIEDQLQFINLSRNIFFEYLLLDKDEKVIGYLENVTASLSYASFAQIKGTARFKISEYEKSNINFLNDRIQIFFCLKMPDGGVAKWSMGIYLLNTPKRNYNGVFFDREIEAYDKNLILLEDKFEHSYLIPKRSNIVNYIINIISDAGIPNVNIPANEVTLVNDKEFEPNTTKITAINELLTLINYETLQADENGIIVSKPYLAPKEREIQFYYLKNKFGIMLENATTEEDAFNAFNVFSAVVSNPEIEMPMIATYVNDNPSSPISTIQRGRRIVKDRYELSDGTTQDVLDNYVRRRAMESSQIYSYVEFSTVLMPHHTYLNSLFIDHNALDYAGIYSETRWEMELRAGGVMKHYCRKLVEI